MKDHAPFSHTSNAQHGASSMDPTTRELAERVLVLERDYGTLARELRNCASYALRLAQEFKKLTDVLRTDLGERGDEVMVLEPCDKCARPYMHRRGEPNVCCGDYVGERS